MIRRITATLARATYADVLITIGLGWAATCFLAGIAVVVVGAIIAGVQF